MWSDISHIFVNLTETTSWAVICSCQHSLESKMENTPTKFAVFRKYHILTESFYNNVFCFYLSNNFFCFIISQSLVCASSLFRLIYGGVVFTTEIEYNIFYLAIMTICQKVETKHLVQLFSSMYLVNRTRETTTRE